MTGEIEFRGKGRVHGPQRQNDIRIFEEDKE
jgi:hypothetical protein